MTPVRPPSPLAHSESSGDRRSDRRVELGGVPFIAINGPVHHYSGKRLTQFILNALGEVGVTIDVPE